MIRLIVSLFSGQEQVGEEADQEETNDVEENIPLSTQSFKINQSSTQQQRI